MKNSLIISIAYLALALTTFACGAGERQSISEVPAGMGEVNRFGFNYSPIHSASGWQQVLSFVVADNAPPQIAEAAMAAAETWNEAVGREILRFSGRQVAPSYSTLYEPLNDNITMIYFETEWAERTQKPDYTLATAIWENSVADRSAIQRADIILNAANYQYQDAYRAPLDDSRVYDVVDSQTVILHEMGHILGLDHVPTTTDADSVMLPHTMIGLGMSSRVLSAGDVERIQSIYLK